LLCLSGSSRRIARELGVQVRTGYRWRCWLRKASLPDEIESMEILGETVKLR
jgi:hypothetical protein